MTRRASAMLGTTRVSSGGAGSVLVWTLTQNTLDRARDEGEMQPPSIGRCAAQEGAGRAGSPTDPALRRGTVTADVMSGRCMAGEDQRGCWNPIRYFAPLGKRDSTSWICGIGGRMSGPKGLCQR
jgi:hypothetical protein